MCGQRRQSIKPSSAGHFDGDQTECFIAIYISQEEGATVFFVRHKKKFWSSMVCLPRNECFFGAGRRRAIKRILLLSLCAVAESDARRGEATSPIASQPASQTYRYIYYCDSDKYLKYCRLHHTGKEECGDNVGQNNIFIKMNELMTIIIIVKQRSRSCPRRRCRRC